MQVWIDPMETITFNHSSRAGVKHFTTQIFFTFFFFWQCYQVLPVLFIWELLHTDALACVDLNFVLKKKKILVNRNCMLVSMEIPLKLILCNWNLILSSSLPGNQITVTVSVFFCIVIFHVLWHNCQTLS